MTTLTVVAPIAITEAMLVSSSVPEDDHPAWLAGTTYADGDRVIYNHRIYESAVADNLGNNPETDSSDPPNWVDVGPTNRWACLDSETSTVTEDNGPVTYVFQPGRFASLALIDMQATSVYIKIESAVDGVLYQQTHIIYDNTPVPDWYQYFYQAIRAPKEIVIDDLIPLGDVTVTITINNTAGAVRLGTLVFGWQYRLGDVRFGARAGIIDYSKKETDAFGATTFVRRAFSKRAELPLWLTRQQVDYVHTVLAELRATPCLWRGADGQYTVLTVFGFYRDFDIEIAYPNDALYTLTLEGLT